MNVYAQALTDAAALLAGGSPDVYDIIVLSLRVSGIATLIACLIGIPVGYVLGMSRFAGRAAIIVLVNTAMGFPPVVVGLFVYMALSNSGPLGFLNLLFTPTAMIAAQVFLAAPLMAGVSTAAIGSVSRNLRVQVRALGASRSQEAWAVLRAARRGVLSAIIAGFGGVISEVGAVSIVGGSITGSTMVMTTAIQANVRMGQFGLAMAWALVLVGIVIVVNVGLTTLQQLGDHRDR